MKFYYIARATEPTKIVRFGNRLAFYSSRSTAKAMHTTLTKAYKNEDLVLFEIEGEPKEVL